MGYQVLKVLLSAVLIVAISELGKRSSAVGAILASIPLVSVLAFIWIYVETKNVKEIANLAGGIFWLVIPSLVLFVLLPVLLRQGWNFWLSLFTSGAVTVLSYFIMIFILKRFGIEL